MKTSLMSKVSAGAIALGMLATAVPALADTSTSTATSTANTYNVVCAQNAVAAREDAIASSTVAYNIAVSAALSTRKTDLVAAWAQTNVSARVDALTAAFKKYRASVEVARTNMQTSRKNAQTTFTTAMKACGVTRADVHATSTKKIHSDRKDKEKRGKGIGVGLRGDFGLHLGKNH